MALPKQNARRFLVVHLRVFAAATALFVAGDLLAADGAWLFWPVPVWGFLVFVHYMYVKGVTIDSRWAQRRARDVTEKAYDAGHIEDIRKRYLDRTPK